METVDLRDYLEPLRKWWWLLTLSTLFAGISSATYTLQQPPVYRAATTLMVGTALMDLNPNDGEIYMAHHLAGTYADMAGRSAIREATQRTLALDWLPEYTVYALPNTNLIEISVIDSSPERAQAVAAELANQLIRQSPGGNTQQSRQSFLEGQLAQLEASITKTNEEIARLEQELAGYFRARQIADARAQIAALETKVSSLQANYADLLANSRQGATNTITVLDPAELPTVPLASDLLTNTVIAAIVGFALAAAGAYAFEYFDQSLRNEHEATRHLNLVALGVIPRVSRQDIQKYGPLASVDTRAPLLDAYTSLRLNVQAMLDDRIHRTLLVTSPGPKEGKSTAAANLAVDWARAGHKVILVDADLYHPTQQRLFGLSNQIGLTTALVHPQTDLDELLRPTEVHGLYLLTSGPILPNPTPLLAQQSIRTLLAELRAKADIVIIDSPPATAVVDASILALQTDGVLLVISADRSRRDSARRTVELLQQIRAQVLGIALFHAPLQHTLYKDYRHSYRGRFIQSETSGSHLNHDAAHLQRIIKPAPRGRSAGGVHTGLFYRRNRRS